MAEEKKTTSSTYTKPPTKPAVKKDRDYFSMCFKKSEKTTK